MSLYETIEGIENDCKSLFRSRILPKVFPMHEEKTIEAILEHRNALFYGAILDARTRIPFVSTAYAGLTTCHELVEDLWRRLPYVMPKRTFWEWVMQGERKSRELSPDDAQLITELSGTLDDFRYRPKYELERHCIDTLRGHAALVDNIITFARQYEEKKQEAEDDKKES